MKFLVLIALVGLAVALEELKKDKKDDDRRGLVWPLPDPHSEGDLMLHGEEIYDRVEQLHKQKLDNDQDKTILTHGRQFLRRVQKYLDETPDFKVIPTLCKDSRTLNGTNRWEIESQKREPVDPKVQQKDAPIEAKSADKPAEKADDAPHRNETRNETEITLSTIILSTTTTVKPQDKQNDKPQDKPAQDKPIPDDKDKERDDYREKRRDFYRQVGQNFVRLLERQWRKEQLSQDENEYVARWNSDEAVHYGTVAIYCHEGENVKEIKKQIAAFLEEKP